MTKTAQDSSSPSLQSALTTEPQRASTKPRRRRMARQPAPSEDQPVAPEPARTLSKIGQVLALLRRAEGATLAELIAATGWLPHTTRAALSGLRKKQHAIVKTQRGEATCYRIGDAA